jgi:hypothetical protein
VGSAHNVFVGGHPRAVSVRTAVLCLIAAAAITVGTTLALNARSSADQQQPLHTADTRPESSPSVSRVPAGTTPKPASSASPPVVVEGVTGPVSDLAGRDFALPEELRMSAAELKRFNTRVAADSTAFASWYADHRGTVVESGTITVTLRGNDAEEVRISDIDVRKKCGPPLDGTYFQGHSAGTGDTVRVAFDLDSPNPFPERRTRSGQPTGRNYFNEKTLSLKRGERETLSVSVYSERFRCSFTLELVVVTSHGVFTQRIDRQGDPFVLTAQARSSEDSPFAGYKAAYQEDLDGWHAVDPADRSS